MKQVLFLFLICMNKTTPTNDLTRELLQKQANDLVTLLFTAVDTKMRTVPSFGLGGWRQFFHPAMTVCSFSNVVTRQKIHWVIYWGGVGGLKNASHRRVFLWNAQVTSAKEEQGGH